MPKTIDELLSTFAPPWGPFDYLALGDRERIHTEALRWLFMEHAPWAEHRGELLRKLLGTTGIDYSVVSAESELGLGTRRLDLWITLHGEGRPGIAIENKLLALESKNQTHSMVGLLREKGYHSHHHVFLSLRGSPSGCPAWKPVSYGQLLDVFRLALATRPGDGFLSAYLPTLERLVAAVDLAVAAPAEVGEIVFGGLQVERNGPWEQFRAYVEKLNLGRTLQSVWLEAVAESIKPPTGWAPWIVAESRGEALIETQCIVSVNSEKLRLGFQLQHDNPKAFVAPAIYGKRVKPQTLEAVSALVSQMSGALAFGGRISPSKGLGFRSTRAFAAPTGRNPVDWIEPISGSLTKIDSWVRALHELPEPMPSCDCAPAI